MRPKKIHSKLSLNKKTIADLNKNEMKSANGGSIPDTVCNWTEMIGCTIGCLPSEPQYFTCTCSEQPHGCKTE